MYTHTAVIFHKHVFAFLKLLPKLTRNFIKEGYMEKTGPKVTHLIIKESKQTRNQA